MVTESRTAFAQKGKVLGVEPGELLMKFGE